jgi:heme-degrading monooxygenase HmoA
MAPARAAARWFHQIFTDWLFCSARRRRRLHAMRDRPPARAIRGENDIMAIYQSMQRVRFRSAGDYEQFKLIFAGVRHHLKTLPGFLHLTWWTHPDDPTWHNEVSFWTSFDALKDWHMNTYHKHAKQWAVRSGAIMEDIITNFELKSTRLIRVCPCCGHAQDKPYELDQEQHALAQPCSQCGFHFPRMPETPDSFAVFKDITHDAPIKEAGDRKPAGAKTAA